MSDFPSGGGTMGKAIRDYDWSKTPLGPYASWPLSLKTIVQMMVQQRHAICIVWGPDLTLLYNDAYAVFLGSKENRALGRPFSEVWSEIWSDIGPLVEQALAGHATYDENMRLIMNRNGFDEETFWTFSYSPLYDDDGKIAGMIDVAVDTTPEINTRRVETAHLEQLIRDSAFMHSILESSTDCIKVLNLEGDLIFMSGGGMRVMEVDDFEKIRGCQWPTFWPGDGQEKASSAVIKARTGETTIFEGAAPTAKGNMRYWEVTVSPIFGENGVPSRILSVSRDITAKKDSERQREMLARELHHRVNNTLTVVSAITTQSMRTATSLVEAQQSIAGRIRALAKANTLLVDDKLAYTTVSEVIHSTIEPFDESRFSLDGDLTHLGSRASVGLALNINELCTNATKHGALSASSGRITIDWKHQGAHFVLAWTESGGPTVKKPTRTSFGSKLIKSSFALQLGGTVEMKFEPSGLVCIVTVPWAALGRES